MPKDKSKRGQNEERKNYIKINFHSKLQIN